MKQEYDVVWPEGFQFEPAKVNPEMKDHGNDPFFVKKLEEAKKTLEKVKFPPNWRERK